MVQPNRELTDSMAMMGHIYNTSAVPDMAHDMEKCKSGKMASGESRWIDLTAAFS